MRPWVTPRAWALQLCIQQGWGQALGQLPGPAFQGLLELPRQPPGCTPRSPTPTLEPSTAFGQPCWQMHWPPQAGKSMGRTSSTSKMALPERKRKKKTLTNDNFNKRANGSIPLTLLPFQKAEPQTTPRPGCRAARQPVQGVHPGVPAWWPSWRDSVTH